MDMVTIFLVAGLAIAFTIFLALYRAVFGPGVFNQAVAMNVIGTKVIVLLIVIGYIFERPVFVDIALLYAVLNFVATLIMAKYLERGEICSA
jgi:multicomponent Na+:H+ antiporter subunit F